jgi:hypothetical protein
MIIEPEARLGFWSLAFLVRLHQTTDIRAAVDVADLALKEFDAMADEINEQTAAKEQS